MRLYMNIELKNIGKIKECNISLDGITVVAGINSTGKSTIGKTLYSVYHSFYDITNQISNQRNNSLHRILSETLEYVFFIDEEDINEIVNRFKGKSVDYIEKNLPRFLVERSGGLPEFMSINYKEASRKIFNALSISNDEVLKKIFMRNIVAELGNSIGNVNYPELDSSIRLKIKNEEINIEISDEITSFNYVNLYKDIIYIDDPFVMDHIKDTGFLRVMVDGHKKHLLMKLLADNNPDIIGELVTAKKLDEIYKKLSLVCKGSMIKEHGKWVYRSEELKKDLDLNSLSAGIKNFMILRSLLEKGAITSNGIVVLDEPEINLHPEWQVILAEILVLLNKEFDLNILLNTHSPYFLNAIEIYSKKYNVANACKYYLSSNINDFAVIEDVTPNIEKIYELLATPLQILEGEAND